MSDKGLKMFIVLISIATLAIFKAEAEPISKGSSPADGSKFHFLD